MEASISLRVDKWLWAARFFRTRSLAARACTGGKVDVNDEAAKPARPVRAGDVVKVTVPGGRRIARVVGLSERRGPAPQGRALYEELTPPAPARARSTPPSYRAAGTGRPTKRERRQIERMRGW